MFDSNIPILSNQMKGEAWRLPGQIEHETMPEYTRVDLCALIFEHLKSSGKSYFQFEIGRFERYGVQQDLRELPTPLATFLRKKPWIAASTLDDIEFKSPRECWASRERRGETAEVHRSRIRNRGGLLRRWKVGRVCLW